MPFALLFALLRDVEWTPRLLRALPRRARRAGASCSSAIGFLEYATRASCCLEPEGDRRQPVRVVLPRQLAVLRPQHLRALPRAGDDRARRRRCCWTRGRAPSLAGGVLLAVLWAGLVLTFSQSSFAALLSGLAVLAALRWSRALGAAVAVLRGVVGAGLVIAAPPGALQLDLGTRSRLDKRDERARRPDQGRRCELFGDRPLSGLGLGRLRARVPRASEHVVEQARRVGVAHDPGHRRRRAGRARPARSTWRSLVVGAAVGCCGGARGAVARSRGRRRGVRGAAVHTMLYAAFLEDPLTWALLGRRHARSAAAARCAARSPRTRRASRCHRAGA